MLAWCYRIHVLPDYVRVGSPSPVIQLQVTYALMDNANVAITLPALAVLLYVSLECALHQEMAPQAMGVETILVKELFVLQTVIIV